MQDVAQDNNPSNKDTHIAEEYREGTDKFENANENDQLLKWL